MQITKSHFITSFKEINELIRCIDVDYVIVGGSAAMLQGIPITTSDIDLFFLLNNNSSTDDIKRTLTNNYQSCWHNDGGFWDSHNNLICGLPFDFRLIEKTDYVWNDFHENKMLIEIENIVVHVRKLEKLISDAVSAADHYIQYDYELERVGHYRHRAKILRDFLQKDNNG